MLREILFGLTAVAALAAVPAEARRTAIDQIDDPITGTPISTTTTLGGYCDLTGEDCDRAIALAYKNNPYTVTFADGQTFSSVFVHGNGLLTFGSAIDFSAANGSSTFYQQIVDSQNDPVNVADVNVVDYGKDLISVGQSNATDPLAFDAFGLPFFQSAETGTDGEGRFYAEFFTCYAPGPDCHADVQRLTLTPTGAGLRAAISGKTFGNDRGYVIGGKFVAAGNDFLIPATITGLVPAVPEPGTWVLLVGGLGFVGTMLRRRPSTRLARA